MHTTDLHATLLLDSLIGLNHEELTYLYGTRNFGLTDVKGNLLFTTFAQYFPTPRISGATGVPWYDSIRRIPSRHRHGRWHPPKF